MIQKKYNRITEVPIQELEKMMREYGRDKSKSTRTSRKYLREIGMNILPNGIVVLPKNYTSNR